MKRTLAGGPALPQGQMTTRHLDPELAAHLLTRKVADVGSPAWNAKLAKLLRRVQVGREVFGEEED
jgi:hypothetical protein